MKEKIGFIGLGTMGKPMALNLLKEGYPVMGYDINPKRLEELKQKGAAVGRSSKEVAGQSDVIITILPNSQDVEEAILGENGVLAGVRESSIVIEMSTIDTSVSRKIAKNLSEKNIKMLDAPVSGGQKGAEAGTLAIMVGGEEEIYNKCLNILQAMGKKLFYCGPNGSGTIVKITNNLLSSLISIASSEALVLGVKAGVNFKVLFDVINASSGQNWVMQYRGATAFKGDFEPGFRAELAHKDVGLAMNLAREEGVPLLMGGLGYQILTNTLALGLGKKDTSIVVKVLEDLVDVKLRL